jgi:hypothetical protein
MPQRFCEFRLVSCWHLLCSLGQTGRAASRGVKFANPVVLVANHNPDLALVGLAPHSVQKCAQAQLSLTGHRARISVAGHDRWLFIPERSAPLIVAPHAPSPRVSGCASEQLAQGLKRAGDSEIVVYVIAVAVLAGYKQHDNQRPNWSRRARPSLGPGGTFPGLHGTYFSTLLISKVDIIGGSGEGPRGFETAW